MISHSATADSHDRPSEASITRIIKFSLYDPICTSNYGIVLLCRYFTVITKEDTINMEYALGDRTLKYGCEGQDVKLMQEMLLKLGYDLGSWGCDGDFGDCTDLALRAFQTDAKLDVDGECGPSTLVALEKAVDALSGAGCDGDSCPINVTIVGGNCYIRTAPNTDGKILGVAHRGDTLPYGGQVSDGGWLLVQYKGQNAWVSGKYGRIG